MEEARDNKKVESTTETEAVSQPAQPEPVSLSAEEQAPVPQPQVVVSPEVELPQKKVVVGSDKPSFFKKYGLIIVTLDVILVLGLVVMGVSYWRISQTRSLPSPTPTPTSLPTPTPSEETDAQTSTLEEQGTSDEIEDIEADLEATDLSEIDKELEDIESELTSP